MQKISKILCIFTLVLLVMSMTGAAASSPWHYTTRPTNSGVAEIETSNQPTTVPTIPTTIRVLRYRTGVIETVDFKDYCRCVLSMEWGVPSFSQDVLKAGAMAVKNVGMYAILHPKYPGKGYDVTDTSADQVYLPGSEVDYTDAAIDATWDYVMTRNGEPFDAGYNDNYNASPYELSTSGAVMYSAQGKDWQWILHHYYDPMDIQRVPL
jgi:peptidoglycan hydrolase-like amidase